MTDADPAALDSGRGWLLVGLTVVSLLLLWGFVFTFTVYADSLGRAFGLSSLRVSSVFSITTGAFFVAGGSMGVLIARARLRPVVATAGVTMAAAVGLLQVVDSYGGLVLAFGLIGAAGGTVFVVLVSLVPLWFVAYEGRAMGVTMTGNGLGVLAMPFAWVWLLARTDVQVALGLVGGAVSVAVLLTSLIARRPPGLEPEGAGAFDAAWLLASLRNRAFLVALVGYPLLWGWYFVLSAGLVDVLTASGVARTVAATAFSAVGGVSVLARLGSGAVADVVGARRTLTAGVVLAAVGLVVLVVAGSGVGIYVSLVVFGVGLGAIATLFSPVLVNRFGPEHAPAVVGVFTAAEATTAFGAPIGVSLLVGVTGGYAVPLVALAVVTLVGAGLFYWGTGPPGSAGRSAGS